MWNNPQHPRPSETHPPVSRSRHCCLGDGQRHALPEAGNASMRRFLSPVTLGRLSILSAAILGSALLISSERAALTQRDKAFYLHEKEASFVRPGLMIKITSADIATDGTIRATFKLTDPKGLALDRLGVVTPGTVSVSFIAATIPSNATQYTAYTTRVQTSPITGKS